MPTLATPFSSWESTVDWLLGPPLRILLIVLIALAVRWAVHRAVGTVTRNAVERADDHERTSFERMLDRATGARLERRRQRALTMGSLLRSTSTFVIGTVALLTILAELGVPLGPILTSAGIGGVAIGFGAQSLVKDFLSGIFMIIEDQYGVGDVIDTGEAIGTVEEVSLRVTRLRDGNGVVWFIRNGEIVRIGNRSQGWAMATIDIPVYSGEDPEKVIAVLRTVVEEVHAEEPWKDSLLEAPTVAGVESVDGGAMTLRIFAKTRPGEQHAVPREIRERALVAFEKAGIRGPVVVPYQGPQV